jgi:hypothetical protein
VRLTNRVKKVTSDIIICWLRAGSKNISTLFLFGTFNCSFIQHRVQVFIASPSLSLFTRSRGSHSFRVSSPILEASGGGTWENLLRGGKARGRDKGKEGEKATGVYKAGAEEGSVGREDGRERQEEKEAFTTAWPTFLGIGPLGDLDEIFI